MKSGKARPRAGLFFERADADFGGRDVLDVPTQLRRVLRSPEETRLWRPLRRLIFRALNKIHLHAVR